MSSEKHEERIARLESEMHKTIERLALLEQQLHSVAKTVDRLRSDYAEEPGTLEQA